MHNKENITKAERSEISILYGKGYAMRAIARALGRSPNSISYELRRNSTKGAYDPGKADAKSRVRKKYRRFQWSKIDHDDALRRSIIRGLRHHWNPDEIAGRMKRNHAPVVISKTAIYAWLRTTMGERYCRYLYSKRRYVKKRKSKTERVMIPNRISLEKRPRGATNRTRYGHWEEDTMVSGKRGRGAAAIAVERKSRFIEGRIIPSLSPMVHAHAVREMLSTRKSMSITFDNGIENKRHEDVGIASFFCDAYASWQKGSVENANKMIRRYLPKGTNMGRVSPQRLDRIVSIINRKPRKILHYRTALEVATRAGVV